MKKLTKFKEERNCNKCGKVKPAKDFGKHGKEHPFSLKSACKKCEVVRVTKWIEKNREKYNKYHNRRKESNG